MFTRFYHHTVKNYVASFGNIFNSVRIARFNSNYSLVNQTIKVPFSYGPKQKWLARLTEENSIDMEGDARIEMTLPRMSYEFIGLSYDNTRTQNPITKHYKINSNGAPATITYQRTPYNYNFNLHVMVKNTDDGLQIMEQILPYFMPDITISVRDLPELDIISECPVYAGSITKEDTYEGDFNSYRVQTWTVPFFLKGFLYKPVSNQGLIEKIVLNYYSREYGTTPPPKIDERSIIVPNPLSASKTDAYGYIEVGEALETRFPRKEPKILHVEPDSGTAGDQISLIGPFFDVATQAKMDNQTATIVSRTPGQVDILVPTLAASTNADIYLQTSNGYTTKVGVFQYSA